MKWALLLIPSLALAQFHRADQDREIRYWLLDPSTHQFLISHDFTVDRVGQASVEALAANSAEHQPGNRAESWRQWNRAVGGRALDYVEDPGGAHKAFSAFAGEKRYRASPRLEGPGRLRLDAGA